MAGMIYPAMIGARPPCAMMYQPFLMPEQAPTRESQQQSSDDKCPDRKRPASQATSVKAEPGSIMAMSESSKKVNRSSVDVDFGASHRVQIICCRKQLKKLLHFILFEF